MVGAQNIFPSLVNSLYVKSQVYLVFLGLRCGVGKKLQHLLFRPTLYITLSPPFSVGRTNRTRIFREECLHYKPWSPTQPKSQKDSSMDQSKPQNSLLFAHKFKFLIPSFIKIVNEVSTTLIVLTVISKESIHTFTQ